MRVGTYSSFAAAIKWSRAISQEMYAEWSKWEYGYVSSHVCGIQECAQTFHQMSSYFIEPTALIGLPFTVATHID